MIVSAVLGWTEEERTKSFRVPFIRYLMRKRCVPVSCCLLAGLAQIQFAYNILMSVYFKTLIPTPSFLISGLLRKPSIE